MGLFSSPPFVSVLVVNYNTKDAVIACIRSLLKQEGVHYEIIVVDNASQDGSVNALKACFSDSIQLIENPSNVGFGQANNLAAREARGTYLYLLNPDAQLTQPDDLKNLSHFMQMRKNVGLSGTKIIEPQSNKIILPQAHYPQEQHLRYTRTLKKLSGKWAWVLGASMMIPKVLYQTLNGFDPDFFLYGEEVDLCLRVRQCGYEIAYCDTVLVEHMGGASERAAVPKEKWLRKYRGLWLFCRKHYDARDVKHIAMLHLNRIKWHRVGLTLQKFLGRAIEDKKQRLEARREILEQMYTEVQHA